MFSWPSPAGDDVNVPPFDSIESGVFRKARHLNEMDMIFTLIEAVADEDALAVLDKLPAADLGSFFSAWSEDAAPKS